MSTLEAAAATAREILSGPPPEVARPNPYRPAAMDPDHCPGCGATLAVIRGKVLWPGERGGPAVEEKGTARARRQSYIGCGSCGVPVVSDHPRQKQLDAEWEAVEARERGEAQRASQAPPATPAQHQVSPFERLAEQVDFLMRERKSLAEALLRCERAALAQAKHAEELAAEHGKLEARVKVLEQRPASEPPKGRR